MKKIKALLFVAVFFLANKSYSQNCPTISLNSPYEVKQDDMAVFSANLSGLKTGVNVTYNWMVSSGAIVSGQGTAVINVSTKCLAGQSVTATVEIGGLSKECSSVSSSTTSISGSPAEAELRTNGEYITIKSFTDEANKFVAGIIIPASYTPVFFLYPGKDAGAGAVIKTMTTVLVSALKKKGINPSGYKIITGGKRIKTSYEIWSVPECATEPAPTPADKELNATGFFTTAKKFDDAANTFARNMSSEKYVLQVPRAVIFLYPGKNAAAETDINEMTQILKTAFAKPGLKTPTIIKGVKKPLALTTFEMWIVSEHGTDPMPKPAQ